MPRVLPTKKICHACRLHFNGETLTDIAILLEVSIHTLSRWRKTQIWNDFEAKLIDEWHQETKQNESTENGRATAPRRKQD
ncbi:hypothetical protein F4054_09665 [Candidatus Poribacteria bacterium]|nr:hypothetical protein [Candidatus Poribacteria bacterium]